MPGAISPMLWGIGRDAKIIFPLDLLEQLDARSRQALLMHELAHFRRGDHWVRLLETFVTNLYWWNPVVWLARRELHQAEEDCCDAWVVAQLPHERETYARALLQAIDFISEPGMALPPAASGIGYFKSIQHRLRHIMTGRAPRQLTRAARISVVFLAIVALMLPALQAVDVETTVQATNNNPDALAARSKDAAPGDDDFNFVWARSQAAEPTEFATQPLNLTGQTMRLHAVAISPDGKLLASGAGMLGERGELIVRDLESGKPLFREFFSRGVRSVDFSPTARLLAAGTFTNEVVLVDLAKMQIQARWVAHDRGINSVKFSPDGHLLATGSLGSAVKLWEVAKLIGKAPPPSDAIKLQGHKNQVFTVAFSPDGKTLVSAGRDKQVVFWNVANGELQRDAILLPSEIEGVAVSPDGQTVAAACWDGKIRLLNSADGEIAATLGHNDNGSSTAVIFSRDGKTLYSAGSGGVVKSWDYAERKLLTTVQTHDRPVKQLALSPDGARLATCSEDASIKTWNTADGENVTSFASDNELSDPTSPITAVAWSPDKSLVASAHEDRSLRLRDARAGRLLRTISGHEDIVAAITFAPQGGSLATASYDGTIKIWNVADGALKRTLRGHDNWVMSVAYSSDGRLLATGSYDKTVRLWDAGTGKELLKIEGHSAAVRSVAFSHDGNLLATAGSDRIAKIWQLPPVDNEKPLAAVLRGTLKGHAGAIRSVAFAPDGKTVATASEDQTMKFWDVTGLSDKVSDAAAPEPRVTIQGEQGMIWSIAYSPGGKTLASAGFERTIKLWNTETNALRASLRGHRDVVTSLAFASDTSALVSGSYDGTLSVWQSSGVGFVEIKPLATIANGTANMLTVAISPDNKLLAIGGSGPKLTIRNLQTGKLIRTLDGLSGGVAKAVFSPDGRQLATACQHRTIEIWDVETGERVMTLKGHTAALRRVAYSSDGKRLISASWDKTAKVWDLADGSLIGSTPEQSLPVSDAKFTPDGKRFVTTTGNWREWKQPGDMKLWDASDCRELVHVGTYAAELKGAIVLPRGNRAVSFAPMGARIWDLNAGAELSAFSAGKPLTAAALFPDGRRIALGDAKGNVSIWDLASGRQLARLLGHEQNMFALTVSADGSLLVGCSRDGTTNIWPLKPKLDLPQRWSEQLKLAHDESVKVHGQGR